jgi:hypothetical protein
MSILDKLKCGCQGHHASTSQCREQTISLSPVFIDNCILHNHGAPCVHISPCKVCCFNEKEWWIIKKYSEGYILETDKTIEC